MEPTRVLLLPGIVLPAELAYGALLASLGPGIDAVAKDLEVYSGPRPPAGYSLDTEVDGLARFADDRGWDTIHLAGYSGGGTAALAFTARRVRSLALLEPAWAGSWDWSPEHRQVRTQYRQLRVLPPDERRKPKACSHGSTRILVGIHAKNIGKLTLDHEKRLMAMENVVGVGVDNKETGGEGTVVRHQQSQCGQNSQRHLQGVTHPNFPIWVCDYKSL